MGKYRIILDGKTYEMEVERLDDSVQRHGIKTESKHMNGMASQSVSNTQGKSDNTVISPMPGTIVKVIAKEGDKVSKGQTVLVLEAMKMENDIPAPNDGIIKKMHVDQGTAVQGGTLLFEIDE